jgi:hypothetical protein
LLDDEVDAEIRNSDLSAVGLSTIGVIVTVGGALSCGPSAGVVAALAWCVPDLLELPAGESDAPWSGTIMGGGTLVNDREEAFRWTSWPGESVVEGAIFPSALVAGNGGGVSFVGRGWALIVVAVVGVTGETPFESGSTLMTSTGAGLSLVGAPTPIIPLIAEEIEVVRARLPKIDTRTEAVVAVAGCSWVGVA